MTPRRSVLSSPKHRWSHEDRLILALFDCLYENHQRELTTIFNAIRTTVLKREGFRRGIPLSSIAAQLHEFRRGGPGSRVYQSVSVLSSDEIACLHKEHLKSIEATAQKLNIRLVKKKHTCEERLRPPPVFRLYRHLREDTVRSEATVTTWVPDSESDFEIPYTPSKKAKEHTRTPKKDVTAATGKFLPATIIPKVKTYNSHKYPYFVYRAFELNHGFKARRFLHTTARIPAPPPFTSKSFSKAIRPHLNRDIDYQSPFLSFARNPKVAFKHIFNKVEQGTQMAFAVFKYDDIKKDAVRRFGLDSGPYLVPEVCKQHALNDLPGGYVGYGEFLTWGSVGCEPFAIVNAADAIMIRAIMRTTHQIDEYAGERLRKYLPPMDDKHLELFLFQLLRGFKRPGYLRARKSTEYTEFVAGATGSSDRSSENTPILIESDIDDWDDHGNNDRNDDGDDDFAMIDDDSIESDSDDDLVVTPESAREPSPNWWRSDDSSDEDYDWDM